MNKYFNEEFKIELTCTLKLALIILLIYSIIFIRDVQAADFGSRYLSVGETWDLGNGYSITANSIDAKATPKQVWLTLYDSGVKLDDKVVAEGQVCSYIPIGGSTAIFSTYVASIEVGSTSDRVLLTNTYTERPATSGGSISVSSSPSGASIYLDGSFQGTTTSSMTVDAGSHTITLKHPGYQDWSQTIDVVSGQAYSLSPQLTPVPTSTPAPSVGSITVSSSPSGASIYLDGSFQGTTTSTMEVVAGSHTITLKRSGYLDWYQDINVVAGQTYSLSQQLTPVTPVLTATPAPSPGSSYIYGIGIIIVVLIVIVALKLRVFHQETKPAKTNRKVRPEPSVKREPEPVPEALPPSIPKEEHELGNCPSCGAKALEADRFCGECGKPLRQRHDNTL